MLERFGDALQFSSAVTRLFVHEIRVRASNQSTDQAALGILEFLQIATVTPATSGQDVCGQERGRHGSVSSLTGFPSKQAAPSDAGGSPITVPCTPSAGGGWLLLNTLQILAQGPYEVVNSLVQGALPSTLVKCVYIFPDLPPVPATSPTHQTGAITSFTPFEKRILVQKQFLQVALVLS